MLNEFFNNIKENGYDDKTMDFLVDSYKDYFVDRVVCIFGEKYRKSAEDNLKIIIMHYFDNKLKSPLLDYLKRVSKNYFLYNFESIKTKSKSNKENKGKEYYCNKYSKQLYDKLLVNNHILTEDQLMLFSNAFIEKIYLNYINNNRTDTILIYLRTRVNKLSKKLITDEDYILYYMKYIGIDEVVINYIITTYKYLFDEYNIPASEVNLIFDNADNLLYKKSLKVYITQKIEHYCMKKTNSVFFDLDKARNGDFYNQRKILIEKQKSAIIRQGKKHVYYDDKELVDKKLEELYIKCVDGYLNGKSNKNCGTYISTRLNQLYELYSNETVREKLLGKIILITNDYIDFLKEYYKKKDLSYTEQANIEEYMDNELYNYIFNGSYYSDHKEYFKEVLNNYIDSITYTKKYCNNIIKN